ncbi:NUDIX hydrolase [Marinisporobacter balticus]|uniref:ADP-ribose pyrophosphatase n=1 Tax=Marinisporobacter balticus TaxID=2018667 RepID=A0A4R2L2F7_9FIRM|nr:NUDIX hydrolase [Marinisporobacter balticus]TCO79832.1 ADP-ribose pyrophosphatase [Marinisporobacter balticus]
MLQNEKTIRSEKIFQGKIINLRLDTVQLSDEKEYSREIIEHSGGAAIIPITEDNKIIMVRQFRKPVEDFLLEVPAGKLDKGEDPLVCAVRELKEETGYEAKDVKFLFSFYSSPGFSNEMLYLYVAKDLISGEVNPDEGEYIEIESYSIDELLNMIYNGEIKDGKTITAIMAVKDFLF